MTREHTLSPGPLTSRGWGGSGTRGTVSKTKTTYPIDVPLAVVTVAASREGVILSVKLLRLLKQDQEGVSGEKAALPAAAQSAGSPGGAEEAPRAGWGAQGWSSSPPGGSLPLLSLSTVTNLAKGLTKTQT